MQFISIVSIYCNPQDLLQHIWCCFGNDLRQVLIGLFAPDLDSANYHHSPLRLIDHIGKLATIKAWLAGMHLLLPLFIIKSATKSFFTTQCFNRDHL